MLVNGMGCYFPGWSVSIRNGVLVYGWGVSKRDGVFIYRMCSYIQNVVLVNGMGC